MVELLSLSVSIPGLDDELLQSLPLSLPTGFMEALATPVFVPKFPELYTRLPAPPSWIKTPTKRSSSLKMGIGNRAFSHELPADGEEEEPEPEQEPEPEPEPEPVGFGSDLVSRESAIFSQDEHANESRNGENANNPPKPTAPTASGSGGGNRAGLFRTPISGGVQSATSVHGLPRPALAVRNLIEQARFGHLCTLMSRMHHRREGYPFGALVDFAPDPMGHPIFSLSPLAIHTRNLLADPRCTLVLQIPGWSGLSNARVTLFGDVYPLPEDQQEWAHRQYLSKHHQGPSQQWGNLYYFRMHNISDIYFIGGFGTVAWVDVNEYESLQPDKIAVDGGEQNLEELNAVFSKPLKERLSAETEVDDAAVISVDSKGTDVRVRQGAQFHIQRISFDEGHPVETLEEAKAALWKHINKGQK